MKEDTHVEASDPVIEARFCVALTDQLPVLSVSDGVEALLGFAPEEFLAARMSLKDRIHHHDLDIAETLFSRDFRNKSGTFNIRLRQANGRIRCIRGYYEKHPETGTGDATLDLLLQDAKSLKRTLDDAVSMANFRAIMENTDDYIYFKDRNHVFTGASQSLVSLCDPAEHWTDLLGQTDYDMFPEEYADIYYRLEKQVFAGISVAHEVQEILHKDGRKGWVDNRKYPIHDDKGEIIGLYGIARDITERKRADEQLQIFRFVSDHAPDCIFWVDRRARFRYANAEACRELGFSKEELLNMSVLDIDPDMPAAAWTVHWQDLQQKNTITLETRHRRKDGSIFPVEISANFIKFGEEEFNIAFSRNITKRKQAEQALRIASVAFESHESMVITDTDGVILRVNHAFTEATGYTAEEAVGQTPRLLQSGRHDTGFYRAMWETLLHTGKWQGEIWDRRKNGEIYPKLLTISAVKGDDGVVTHYVGADHDITERKTAEEEINNLAFYDSLTQLPNRRLLDDRLGKIMAASKRSGRYGALMFLDLDNFKPLNDTHGHSVGDLLLVEAARRITLCVREVDTVARFGGDEFVVALSELDEDKAKSASQTGIIAEKIRVALGEPYVLKFKPEGKAEVTAEHHCTASIGIVLFVGHEIGEEDILRNADMAMYQAKQAGRNQIWLHEPEV